MGCVWKFAFCVLHGVRLDISRVKLQLTLYDNKNTVHRQANGVTPHKIFEFCLHMNSWSSLKCKGEITAFLVLV